jgi:hypothetical protein
MSATATGSMIERDVGDRSSSLPGNLGLLGAMKAFAAQ